MQNSKFYRNIPFTFSRIKLNAPTKVILEFYKSNINSFFMLSEILKLIYNKNEYCKYTCIKVFSVKPLIKMGKGFMDLLIGRMSVM